MSSMILRGTYGIFLSLCTVTPTDHVKIEVEYYCGYCVEYNPPHWEEDNFPSITMIRIKKLKGSM